LLFTRLPEVYNTTEYSDWHTTQITLYAEFAPKFVRPQRTAPLASPSSTALSPSQPQTQTMSDFDEAAAISVGWNLTKSEDSDFMKFLKTCVGVNLDLVSDVYILV
jgi:hypothetical protein